jgi:Family of unknown function (DUF5829)
MKRTQLLISVIIAMILAGAGLKAQDEKQMKYEVPLNHFFLVLDTQTYKDIEDSEFLKNEFAIFEKRTTVRTDQTYTAIYFYGTNTYFEFFDVNAKDGAKVGDTGIAFGTDQADSISSLQKLIFWTEPNPITRQVGDKQVPWFLMSSPKDSVPDSGISTWIMEYLPTFLLQWHPEVQTGEGITRKEILARYAAFLKQDRSQHLMKDVTGLTVAVSDLVRDQMVQYCSAFGYAIRKDGNDTIAAGSGIVLRFTPQSNRLLGIQEIQFNIGSSSLEQRTFKFGEKSVLTLDSQSARWTF